MRLNRPKRVVNDAIWYERALALRGKQLGRGAYGAVFSLNDRSDRVIKYSRRHDDAWAVFAKICFDLDGISKHTMKVHAFRDHREDMNSFYVAVVERLVPLNHYSVPTEIVELANRLSDCSEVYSNRSLIDLDTCRSSNDWWRPSPAHAGCLKNDFEYIERYHSELHALVQMLTDIYGEIRLSNKPCQLDLHLGNMMYRPSDNSLVITDPFASCKVRRNVLGNDYCAGNEYDNYREMVSASEPNVSIAAYQNIGRVRTKKAA